MFAGMKPALPSDRSFGWTFTTLFLLVGAYGVWRDRADYHWVLALAALTAAVTVARPVWLSPFKRAWARFGDLLHRVVSPVVLGVMFFCIFTPVGWAMRLAGRDAMKRRFEPTAPSYWIGRDPPGPAGDSLRDLF
jgi:saxitoxin biosynthesis operon SxtJ-like protein